MSKDIVIVSAVRTPIGRFGGAFKNIPAATLSSLTISEAIKRAELTNEDIDEVILGEVRQTSESSNVARVAALRAGIPIDRPAFTVNRLCASGMQAITSGMQQIASGQAKIVVVGGTENLSRAPFYIRKARFGEGNPEFIDSNLENGQQPNETYGSNLGMGITAENVASQYEISRKEQDQFALLSQQKYQEAKSEDKFSKEILPVEVKERKKTYILKEDEHPRPNVTMERLSKLKPAFKENGTVTAGNACGRNDGATSIVLMTEENANKRNIKPLARIIDWSTVGLDPKIMGMGPAPAVEKLLAKTKLNKEDIDLYEINEAFASQALAVVRELGLDMNKVNVNGGAIALGHPLGATGARIVTTLLYELKRRNGKYGIASLCIGGGQGMAILIENVA